MTLTTLPELISQNDADKTRRQRALQQFLDTGFPTRKNEDWKYSDLSFLEKRSFELVTQELDQTINLPKLDFDAYEIILINGRPSIQHSSLDDLPDGVIVENMAQRADFLKKTEGDDDALSALNQALTTGGLYLEIPEGLHLAKPVVIRSLNTFKKDNAMIHPRHCIHVRANSHLTLYEECQGEGGDYWINEQTTIELEKNSQLTLIKLQNESENGIFLSHSNIFQEAQSQFWGFYLSLGANFYRETIDAHLNGEGADLTLSGLYLPHHSQHVDYHCSAHHNRAYCRSEQNFRGVLSGKSTGVFNSKAIVSKAGKGSHAEQWNKNLLMTSTADVNAKPELEIYNDDVTCSHGATVGQLDQQALFYLLSRGIPERLAQSMLLEAFVSQILDPIPSESLFEIVQTKVMQRLKQLCVEA